MNFTMLASEITTESNHIDAYVAHP